jgi:hypothetical protein
MTPEPDEMFCPLIKTNCKTEDCAMWNGEMCGIYHATRSIACLSDSAEEMVKKLDDIRDEIMNIDGLSVFVHEP